jgi:cell division protein FtsQ
MARRAAVALVRTPPLRPAVPAALRPGRRALALGLVLLGLAGIAYLAARQTSVFAFRSVEIAGARGPVGKDVRAALRPLEGTSLVALDPGDVEDLLRSVPTVRTAHVDRAFPHGLRVVVRPERPLAVVEQGRRAWVVARSGRIMAAIAPGQRPRLPRLDVDLVRAPALGGSVPAADGNAALAVLDALPRRFPGQVGEVRSTEDGVTLVLVSGPEVRFGGAEPIDAQIAAAAAVLRRLSEDERAAIGYLDASVPTRVVIGTDSEL